MVYEARLLWDDTVCVPTQSCQKYILLRNITHYWLLIIILIPRLLVLFSLDVLLTSYLVQVCTQKFGGDKFCKDRVKMQIWGKPAIFFSWAMSEIQARVTGQSVFYFFWTHFRLSLWMTTHLRMRCTTPPVYLDLWEGRVKYDRVKRLPGRLWW